MVTATAEVTKGDATRQTVLDAAVARFGRDGYRATSVADVARDVGVSASTPFVYFPTKEALFVAAADHDAAAVVLEAFSRLATDASAAARRSKAITQLLEAVQHHPLAQRILAGLEPEFTVRLLQVPALEDVRRLSSDRIRQQQAAGVFRPDVDPEAIANGLVAIVLSMLMAVVQTDLEVARFLSDGVNAVIDAALFPPAAMRPETSEPIPARPRRVQRKETR